MSFMERSHLKTLISRMSEPRKFIQVILGPRQIGKTTIVKQLMNQVKQATVFYSADNQIENGADWINLVWQSARFKYAQEESKEFILIIDEIQKIPNWSEAIKKYWDEDSWNNTNIKLILLGSSRLLIQQGLTESLAGRFETLYMEHWNYSEMKDAFGMGLDEYIYFGGYPGSSHLIQDEERWKRYVSDSLIETSISKDILMLTRVDKPALLRRLFDIGSQYTGQILSFNKLLGQLQDAGNTTTLSHYIELLSDSGLLGKLDKYAGNYMRKRASIPKFQVYNNALLSSRSNLCYDEVRSTPKLWGRYVESAIGSHLMNHAQKENLRIFYWRENNLEVDFIIERNNECVAIEVKSGKANQTAGLKSFQEQFKPKQTLLVGGDGIGIEDFLTVNPKNIFNL